MRQGSREYIQSLASGLIFQCPMGESLEDCEFKKLRKVNYIKNGKLMYKKFCSLSQEELDGMVEKHRTCLSNREG